MKKWLALILAAAAIIVLSVVFINRNSILKHILKKQISSVCHRATLGKTAYAIKDSRLIIKVDNLSCMMKNGSAKIGQVSVSYKIGDLIDAFLKGKTPQGSLKLKSPDIKINLNQIDRKADFGKYFSISAISGGRIKTVVKGEHVAIENIESSGNIITAKLIYKKYRLPILYKTDNAMIRIGFKNLKSSDFSEFLPLSGLKFSMSGMLSYNLNSKKIYIKAAGNNMLLEPYLNIGLPFSVIISANTDKNRYEASFYLKKDTNEIKGKLTSDGKRFMIYSSGRLGSTLLGKSNEKLAKIFKRYRISGIATIRNLTISGKLDNWEKASVYAKGSASRASFRVTHNTPLFEHATGEFELKQGTLYLRKLSGKLGSSTISDAKITISKLFSKPVADMMIPVKLKLDRYSREFFKKLVIPKNLHPLLGYANRLSAKTIISIKNYRFMPIPFFPFKIIMQDVAIFNRKNSLNLYSKLVNIKRDTDIVKIESGNVDFTSKIYSGRFRLFAQIFSKNPDKKKVSIEGKINAKSMKVFAKPLNFPYKGDFRLSIGRETKIGFSGHIRIAAISGALLIKNGQYGGNIKIDSKSPLFSYRANLNIDKNIVNIHAAGKVVSGNFRLKGKYDIKKQYWLARLSASSIKLDEISKLIKHNHKQTNWGKGMLKIKLDNSSYKKIVLPYITADFTFDKDFITSKNIKIRFLNALMGIDCTYGKNKPFIEGNFSYKGKNSRLILQEIGLGQIEASKIYITGAFLIYPKNSYSTNIKFSAYKGNIRHFPALAKLLNYLNLKNILTLNLANFSKRGLKYKKIGGEIVIKNGTVATVKPIVLAGKLDMVFQGRYKIKQKDINGIVGIKTFTLINKIVSKIPIVGWILTGKDKSFSIMTFSVKGKPENPSITPLPIKSVGIGLLNIIKRSLTFPFEVIK